MAGFLSVKVSMNEAARRFPELARYLPTIDRNAINKVVTWAEREAITQVAKDVKLPVRFVRNRLTRKGEVKERRVAIRRATTANLNATLGVYMRGLPVYQVAGLQIRRPGGGVKAKGGRFYKGAFKPATGAYAGMVFKRIGRERLPLMMPKIGLRQRLTAAFDSRVQGTDGQYRFRREYSEQLRKYAARYGVRA